MSTVLAYAYFVAPRFCSTFQWSKMDHRARGYPFSVQPFFLWPVRFQNPHTLKNGLILWFVKHQVMEWPACGSVLICVTIVAIVDISNCSNLKKKKKAVWHNKLKWPSYRFLSFCFVLLFLQVTRPNLKHLHVVLPLNLLYHLAPSQHCTTHSFTLMLACQWVYRFTFSPVCLLCGRKAPRHRLCDSEWDWMELLRNVPEQSPSVFFSCITSTLVTAFFVTWLCFSYIYHASLPDST